MMRILWFAAVTLSGSAFLYGVGWLFGGAPTDDYGAY